MEYCDKMHMDQMIIMYQSACYFFVIFLFVSFGWWLLHNSAMDERIKFLWHATTSVVVRSSLSNEYTHHFLCRFFGYFTHYTEINRINGLRRMILMCVFSFFFFWLERAKQKHIIDSFTGTQLNQFFL